MLSIELRRAFYSWRMVAAILAGIVICWVGMYFGYEPVLGSSGYQAWPYGIGRGSAAIFSYIAPFVAAFPFADSFSQDRVSGYQRYIRLRTSFSSYLKSKMIATGLAGGAAVLLSMLLSFVLALFIYSPSLAPADDRLFGAFDPIWQQSQPLYVVVQCVTGFAFGAVYALLGLVASLAIDKRWIGIVFPFLFYQLGMFILSVAAFATEWHFLSAFEPPSTLIPFRVVSTTHFTVFGELAALLVICLAFLHMQAKNREVI